MQLAHHFTELLNNKRLILILDGLNEMPVNDQQNKGQQIRDFLGKHPQLQAYASCREDDYSDDLRLPLAELHIQPLSIPKIKAFIQGYLAVGKPQHAAQKAEHLFWEIAGGQALKGVWKFWEKAGATHEQFWSGKEIPKDIYCGWKSKELWESIIRDNPQNLIRLARNPYLLKMLMHSCDNSEQVFPKNRGQLLSAFYQLLVTREIERQKDKAELLQDGGKQLEQLIGHLAWLMAEQTQTSMPRYQTLSIMHYNEDWLNLAIRCNIIDQVGEHIRFSHQLLQDYFIAIGLKQRLDDNQLSPQQFWQRHLNWWEPTGWEEPVILLAGLYSDDCSPVVKWIAEENPKLAARCINESGVACADTTKIVLREAWIPRLIDLENDPHPYARATIGTALAQVDLHGQPLDNREGLGLDQQGLPSINWIEIPAGEFNYQENEALHLDSYYMSCFPVTNQQFQAFVDAGGFEQNQWWNDIPKPDSRPNHRWKESNRPVENVSWYEAVAYCRWLSAQKGYKIRLPTEQEWEKAARGTKQTTYPWGNEYKSGFANINETWDDNCGYNLDETSAVGIYPQGQSLYGVMDLSGNVDECCLNQFHNPETITIDYSGDLRSVRGGSPVIAATSASALVRFGLGPANRGNLQGFRVVCFCPITDH